jgi:hypothetical protein
MALQEIEMKHDHQKTLRVSFAYHFPGRKQNLPNWKDWAEKKKTLRV